MKVPNNKRWLLHIAAICFAGLFMQFGCARGTSNTVTKDWRSGVQNIEIGKTTKAEVVLLMGRPDSLSIVKDGYTILGYGYKSNDSSIYIPTGMGYAHVVNIPGAPPTHDVEITIDNNGIVSDINSTSKQVVVNKETEFKRKVDKLSENIFKNIWNLNHKYKLNEDDSKKLWDFDKDYGAIIKQYNNSPYSPTTQQQIYKSLTQLKNNFDTFEKGISSKYAKNN